MLTRMDEMKKFKAFLGSAADGYSDAQFRQLGREMHAMAELLLDVYLGGPRHGTKTSRRAHPTFDRLPPAP